MSDLLGVKAWIGVCNNWESVVGSVIQAIGTVEFEDGLKWKSSLKADGTLIAS